MDWGRFQRAMLAERIREVETVRLQSIQGLIQYEHMSDADLAAIAEHDEILNEWQTTQS